MKQYFKSIGVLFFIIGALANSLKAQNIQAGARLDSSLIKLGGQTRFKLSLHCPAKTKVTFPVLKDSLASKIQIISHDKPETLTDKNEPGMATYVQSYTVTSFDPGSWVVPAFTIHTDAGDFKTQVLALQVQAVQVDTAKAIYDIKKPIPVSYTAVDWLRDNWLWVVLVITALLIIAGAIYYNKTRPKKQKPDKKVKILIPEHVVALQKLTELKAKKLWQSGAVKQYHSDISDIIREYLERRYIINAPEQTSDEIFAALRYKDLSEANRSQLRQILILADLVKFARENPLPPDNEMSMENAIAFVSQTQRVIPTETKEEGSNEPV